MPAPSAPPVSIPVSGAARPARRPLLLAGLGASCISASAILITLAGTNGVTTAFYRCALALPVLVTLAVLEQRRHGARAWRARLGAVAAGVLLGADLVLWNHAIVAVGAGIATVLGNLQVLFVAVVAWLVLGERLQRGFVVALPVVLAGVVLVSGLADHGGGGDPVAGIVYGMATSIAYTGFLLILRQTSASTVHVAGPLAEATAGAGASALIFGLAFGGMQFHLPWAAFGWLLLLSASSQTLGWLLITWSLPKLPAAVSSVLLLLQPAAAVLLAAVVLGERPSVLQLLGAVLVCGGVLVASGAVALPPRQRRPRGPVTPGPAAAAEAAGPAARARLRPACRAW